MNMRTATILAILSLVLGLGGSICLAFSLNEFLAALGASSNAHDFAIEQLAHHQRDIVLFGGLDKHIKRGEKSARRRTLVGILMLGGATVLQGLAALATN
jgi:hypothetical protein